MKALTIIPAAEQSKTYMEGVLSHESRSLIGNGKEPFKFQENRTSD